MSMSSIWFSASHGPMPSPVADAQTLTHCPPSSPSESRLRQPKFAASPTAGDSLPSAWALSHRALPSRIEKPRMKTRLATFSVHQSDL